MRKSHLMALMYGWITILVLVLVSSALLALFVRFLSITGFTLSYLTLGIGLLTLFIGGIVTGVKVKEMGLVFGAILGLGFSLLTFLIQYLGFNDMFSVQQLVFHLAYILCAMVGSVVGVNIVGGGK